MVRKWVRGEGSYDDFVAGLVSDDVSKILSEVDNVIDKVLEDVTPKPTGGILVVGKSTKTPKSLGRPKISWISFFREHIPSAGIALAGFLIFMACISNKVESRSIVCQDVMKKWEINVEPRDFLAWKNQEWPGVDIEGACEAYARETVLTQNLVALTGEISRIRNELGETSERMKMYSTQISYEMRDMLLADASRALGASK